MPRDAEGILTMQANVQPEPVVDTAGTSTPDFRALLGVLPAAAYSCGAEGLITYFNQRAVDLWGREPKINNLTDRY
jgi:PAS domain-containing protein